MSESYPPSALGTTWGERPYENRPTAGTDSDSGGTSTAQVVKDQAANVGSGAAEAGQHVAGVAKEQVGQVASEAGRQAKDLLDQARTELSTQGGAQQQRLASSLNSLGDELHSMAHNSDQNGVATDLAKQAASKTRDVASWLESREPGDVLEEVKAFARQRPMAFLALALGAGLVAGRLTRGFKDAPDALSASSQPTASTAATAADVAPFASSLDPASVEGSYDLDGR
jgi:small-conductance mechanosensitive channel